jgi:hypothetical protein
MKRVPYKQQIIMREFLPFITELDERYGIRNYTVTVPKRVFNDLSRRLKKLKLNYQHNNQINFRGVVIKLDQRLNCETKLFKRIL